VQVAETLKIFFYLFLIFLGLCAIKLLSDFEFALRDKTITYQEEWSVDFSKRLDRDIWESDLKGHKKDGKKLLMYLPKNKDSNTLLFYKAMEADSGYFEIKLKTPLSTSSQAKVILAMRDESHLRIPVKDTTGYQRIKTPIISAADIEALEFSLTRTASDTERSVTWTKEDDTQYLKISELRFIAQHIPKKTI